MPTTNNVIAMPDANPETNSPADKPLSIVPDVGDSSFMHDSRIPIWHRDKIDCVYNMHMCTIFLCL